MLVDQFNFDLPEDRIALRPMRPRDAARMLIVSPDNQFLDKQVLDLPFLLRPGDALVINNTKVIHARLKGERFRNGVKAAIEATLIEKLNEQSWIALIKPAKKLQVGDIVKFYSDRISIEAKVENKEDGGQVTLIFDHTSNDLDKIIELIGAPPLPPYIAGKRPADKQDELDYQTYFASKPGAIAAPTAGLHFTKELINKLLQSDIKIFSITLHVGAGTFVPVKVEDTKDHIMHREFAYIDFTDIFITPGYKFKFTDLLLTNFHLPKSTLFMLVSAFSGLSTMRLAYSYAIENKYRFYSYGDACLLTREQI